MAGFAIADYAEEQGHFGSGEIILLIARVSPALKFMLGEIKLAGYQVFSGSDRDGWYELRATVRDTWQLKWRIAAQIEKIVMVG